MRWNGLWKIISPVKKRLGPDGNIHEGWCPIFIRECCMCRDNGKGGRRIFRRDGDSGAKVQTPQKKKLESA